ncbi:MAG: hypothetical protein WC916_00120 [Candidatus Woesearchaeota archaeon]
MNNKKRIKNWSIVIGTLSAIALFFLFGIPTGLIPNSWFTRMIPAKSYDYVFLILSSILLGAYIGLHYYKKKSTTLCNVSASTGGIGGFLAFSCPICNKILVFLFGTTALMMYLEPYRLYIGLLSTGILLLALYWKIKS